MKKKIVLIIPNTRWFGKRPWLSMPYAPLILTAILKDKYDFIILDANGQDLDDKTIVNRLRELSPDLIMVTGTSFEYHLQIHHAFALARKAMPRSVNVLGGVYATTLSEEAAKDTNIDWVFKYHAEERINTFLELVFAGRSEAVGKFPGIAYMDADGQVVETPIDSHIGQIGKMVRPDYSLVDIAPYMSQLTKDYQFNSDKPTSFIITSYGCPHNCVFCASRTISGRRTVFRPVEDVIAEIEYLVTNYGVKNLVFLDDALLTNKKRAVKLLADLIDRDYGLSWKVASVAAWDINDELLGLMAKAGCVQITVSVESGSQRVLKEVIGKPLELTIIPDIIQKCKSYGIIIGANFVIGLPGETWDEIRQSCRFAEECDFDVVHFHIATPLPHTDLYNICKEKRYLPKNFNFLSPDFFGYGKGFITTEEFTPLELEVLRSFEWDRINFSTPSKIDRIAKIYNLTVGELNEHRRQTRRKLGLHF